MPDPKVVYPQPLLPSPEGVGLTFTVLEPGLQAAIDLLKREALNEKSAGEIAEGKDAIAAAMEHAHHYQAYMTAIELLVEQIRRLRRGAL